MHWQDNDENEHQMHKILYLKDSYLFESVVLVPTGLILLHLDVQLHDEYKPTPRGVSDS